MWLSRGSRPPGTTSVLADAVAALELPEGPGRVWGGGEAMAMRAVRDELGGRGVPAAVDAGDGLLEARQDARGDVVTR